MINMITGLSWKKDRKQCWITQSKPFLHFLPTDFTCANRHGREYFAWQHHNAWIVSLIQNYVWSCGALYPMTLLLQETLANHVSISLLCFRAFSLVSDIFGKFSHQGVYNIDGSSRWHQRTLGEIFWAFDPRFPRRRHVTSGYSGLQSYLKQSNSYLKHIDQSLEHYGRQNAIEQLYLEDITYLSRFSVLRVLPKIAYFKYLGWQPRHAVQGIWVYTHTIYTVYLNGLSTMRALRLILKQTLQFSKDSKLEGNAVDLNAFSTLSV